LQGSKLIKSLDPSKVLRVGCFLVSTRIGSLRMETLTNAAEVSEALGGPEGIARLTGAKRTTIWNWIGYFKAFPPRTYVVMIQELERRGYTASPHLWKMLKLKKRNRAA
jgi:hypothetical protein